MAFDFKDGALFDPGYTKYIIGFSPSIEMHYQKITSLANLNQKKFQFKMLYPQILKMINTQIGFYLGCIFWAAYIKQFEDKPIVGNPCISDNYSEEINLFEVNYMQSFLEKFKKDYKYYLNQDFKIEDFKLTIVELYKEFLSLNKGFTIELTTDTLQLPEGIKKITKKGFTEIEKVIENVVSTGNFEEFFEIKDKLIK